MFKKFIIIPFVLIVLNNYAMDEKEQEQTAFSNEVKMFEKKHEFTQETSAVKVKGYYDSYNDLIFVRDQGNMLSKYNLKSPNDLHIYYDQPHTSKEENHVGPFTFHQQYILSAASNDAIRWFHRSQKKMGIFAPCPFKIYALATGYIAQNPMCFAGKKSGEILLWDLKSNKQLETLNVHTDCVNDISVNENGIVASCSNDGNLILSDVRQEKAEIYKFNHDNHVFHISCDENKNEIATATNYGITFIDPRNNKNPLRTFQTNKSIAAFSHKDNFIAVLYKYDKEIEILDKITGCWLMSLYSPTNQNEENRTPNITDMTIHQNKIISCADNGIVTVWSND